MRESRFKRERENKCNAMRRYLSTYLCSGGCYSFNIVVDGDGDGNILYVVVVVVIDGHGNRKGSVNKNSPENKSRGSCGRRYACA